MKPEPLRMLFSRLAVLVVSFLSLAGCSNRTSNSETVQALLHIEYFFATEAAYDRIEIDQNRLTHTYFEDVENRCAQWIAQEPCWAEKDLRTKETDLTDHEISDLIDLIHQTGFMRLEKTYGGASDEQRFYPYTLMVRLGDKEREVLYQSYPGSTPMPEEFQHLAEKLHELVARKFP